VTPGSKNKYNTGFIVLFPIGIGVWLLAKGARAWFLPAGLGIWMYWRVTRKG
jgi:hypothetical protein